MKKYKKDSIISANDRIVGITRAKKKTERKEKDYEERKEKIFKIQGYAYRSKT